MTRERTRERILDAALVLFTEEGFSGTTITEVERRVGLAAGTGSLYRHFRSKEDLFQAAVGREVDLCMAEIAADRQPIPVVDDPQQARVLVLQRMFRGVRRFDRLLRLLLSEGDRVPEIRDTLGAALTNQGEPLSWKDHPTTVILLAALGGYRLFGLVGAPFLQGVTEDDFIEELAALAGGRTPEFVIEPPADDAQP